MFQKPAADEIDSENPSGTDPDSPGFRAFLALERQASPDASEAALERALLRALPKGAKLAHASEEAYPSAFHALEDPPEAVAWMGDMGLAERQSLIAIVGSRDAAPERRAAAAALASELAARGTVIVSGMAAGIDRAAHCGALSAALRGDKKACGRTIAVLGTPLDVPYPSENQDIWEKIRCTGLLLSEAPQLAGRRFSPEERAASLRRRNRLVAALGLGSLVMAARPGSSTLIEARRSLSLGHPVLIWHEAADEDWAKALLAENLRDSEGSPLTMVVSSAAEADEALSPWRRVWWL